MNFSSSPFPWFPISVKSHHEKAVARALYGKGYEAYLPLYHSRHRSAGRSRESLLPLFPTYVFASFDPANRLPILTIPGVFYILHLAGVPAAVKCAELEAIDRVVQSGLPVQPTSVLEVGSLVYIEHGPLRGLQGELIDFRNTCRLVIRVELLQRSVAVEIEKNWIRTIPSPQATIAA